MAVRPWTLAKVPIQSPAVDTPRVLDNLKLNQVYL